MTEKEKKYLYEFVGSKIKDLRNEVCVSQNDLANKLSLSRVSIVNIEKGRQHLSLHLMFEIAKIFNKEIIYFFPSLDEPTTISTKIEKEIEQILSSTGKKVNSKKIFNFLDEFSSDKNE
jgi:DNA-binding XRE family transcriptional regulator